jgi:hypothetical protein
LVMEQRGRKPGVDQIQSVSGSLGQATRCAANRDLRRVETPIVTPIARRRETHFLARWKV